jgi:pimeloyl-ACP methyl ester carboxylesterase/DNA-binding CsgD family transcriptional regulator
MVAPIRYAKSGTVNLAYQVVGSGPVDLVFVPGFVSHLDAAWEDPRLARFLRRLASFSRLILFDKRGIGMSDGGPRRPSARDRVDDLLAVLDAAASNQATLFGSSEGGAACLSFAAAHPQRVRSLATFGAFAKVIRSDDYPWGWSRDEYERTVAEVQSTWLDGAEMRNPTLSGDDVYRRWFTRYLRLSASPGRVREMMQLNADVDIRPLLGGLRLPVLILHRKQDPWVSVDHSRYLASHIPGAELVELEGVDHWPWIGDADSLLDEVERFVTGRVPNRKRRLAGEVGPLTSRELDVVRLSAEGYTAPQIGTMLSIGERTVETHLARAYAKLGVKSKLDLVRRARYLGF